MERDALGWKIQTGSGLDIAMREFISSGWGTNSNRFPGPQPVSIERVHMKQLRTVPYLVCEKNDGVRNMLVCFEFESKKICAFVNRAFEARITTLAVPRGTILDGEMMSDVFLVYDAVLIKGENVSQQPLTERLHKANQMCKTIVGPIRVRVKPMFPMSEVQKVIDRLDDKTDGMIFTPVNEPVRMGTHETLFKWKPRSHITIDFLCDVDGTVDGKPVLGLFIQPHHYITTPAGFSHDLIGKIVECGYGDSGWYLVKERPDKTYPNNKRTYERTIVNIREDIQANEFILCNSK
jgi:hypothetical protein